MLAEAGELGLGACVVDVDGGGLGGLVVEVVGFDVGLEVCVGAEVCVEVCVGEFVCDGGGATVLVELALGCELFVLEAVGAEELALFDELDDELLLDDDDDDDDFELELDDEELERDEEERPEEGAEEVGTEVGLS